MKDDFEWLKSNEYKSLISCRPFYRLTQSEAGFIGTVKLKVDPSPG